MPVRLQRKVRKKRVRAAKRRATLKRLLFMPVIQSIEVESADKSLQSK